MSPATNPVHASAVVVGRLGLIIVGASGAGKSSLAIALIAEARARGDYAALVADDRVFIAAYGRRVIARRPETIRDMIEIRGSGIGRIESLPAAEIHYALQPFSADPVERLPDDSAYRCGGETALPLIPIDIRQADPLFRLTALIAAREAARP